MPGHREIYGEEDDDLTVKGSSKHFHGSLDSDIYYGYIREPIPKWTEKKQMEYCKTILGHKHSKLLIEEVNRIRSLPLLKMEKNQIGCIVGLSAAWTR